jgi:hypothetical protein
VPHNTAGWVGQYETWQIRSAELQGMDFELRHPPWGSEGLIPKDVFLRRVEDALSSEGRWETSAEFRMGGGPTVSVTVVSGGNEAAYRAEAVYLALKLSGTYDSLERALVALPRFGGAVFDVGENTWEGLID